MRTLLLPLAVVCSTLVAAQTISQNLTADQFAQDAQQVQRIIVENYAYLDRFKDAAVPVSPQLDAEAVAVTDRRSLVRYAERMLLALADHHAITGSSLADSWAVVPTYADLWIVEKEGRYLVDALRPGSPAAQAGIEEGAELVEVDGKLTKVAVADFWRDLGFPQRDSEARSFAARILAAGRRDRARQLTFRTGDGTRTIQLLNLYQQSRQDRVPLDTSRSDQCLIIRFNDSLGSDATISAFDAAMLSAAPAQPICLDLTDTPSGGNTVVARAIMGWFVAGATAYQTHRLPSERRTGISRQWIEQVVPRAGKYHSGPVTVRVGRWTGSMGEGLAIGMQALGGSLTGGDMAGLRGAIYNFTLPASGLVINLLTERLYTVDGVAREDVKVTP